MARTTRVTKSSGNIFKDIGITEPETSLAKAEIVRRINAIIKERGLKQAAAAKVLGVDQAKISALSRGSTAGFSTDRLFRFLNALDRDVQIVIKAKPASRERAQVTIIAP